MIVGFVAGGVMMRWMLDATAGQLEVDEERLVYRNGNRVLRDIAWDAITEAGTSSLTDVLWIRAGRTRLAVSNHLIGFGRLVNLVASRAAARSRWTAG